jgi:hypothetical protein
VVTETLCHQPRLGLNYPTQRFINASLMFALSEYRRILKVLTRTTAILLWFFLLLDLTSQNEVPSRD